VGKTFRKDDFRSYDMAKRILDRNKKGKTIEEGPDRRSMKLNKKFRQRFGFTEKSFDQ